MADTFDPDAYLKAPPKESSGFDPDAYLSAGQGKHPILNQLGRAVTDIPNEIGNEASAGWNDLSSAKISKIHPALSPIETAKGVLGAARAVASPIIGSIKSVVGHGLTAAEMAAGEYIANPIAEHVFGVPKEKLQHPDPEKMYEQAKDDTDKAMLAMPAGKTAPRINPPPIPVQEPFGVTRTLGERTGNLPDIQFEQGARSGQHGVATQRQAGEFFDVQRPQELAAAKEDVLRQMDHGGGQLLAENPIESANIAQQTLQSEAARTKAQVTAAYDRAKNLGGEIHTDAFVDMPQAIKTDLTNRLDSVIIDNNTPVASRMIDYLDRQIGQLNITNRAQPQSTGLVAPGPAPKVGVNLEGIEQWRKNLSIMRGDALAAAHNNPSDYRAAKAIIDSFDARVNQAVNSDQFTGSRAAVDAWNTARDMHSQRMRTWGNDPVGRQLQKIIGNPTQARDPMSLNKVADALYSSQGTSPGEANVGLARRVRQIFGEDSPEWAAIRQGMIHRLISVAEGNNERGLGTVATRLNEFLNGRGSDMAEIMLTQGQRSMLREYANLHRQMQVPQLGANWPNTAAGVIPHVKEVGKKIMGAIGAMIGHHFGPVGALAGHGVGRAAAEVGSRVENARNLARARQQMPLVGQAYNAWQRAVTQAQRKASLATSSKVTLTTSNLVNALSKIGIDHSAALRVLQAGPDNTGPANAEPQQRAEGGRVGDDYNTFLTPEQEAGFGGWKQQNAPDDSGYDYDLRGAYLANMQRDPNNNHLGDQFKKPNHPTFSDQSQYAVGDQRERAGHWNGEDFIPPVATRAEGGDIEIPEPEPISPDLKRVYIGGADKLAKQAGHDIKTQQGRLPAPTTDASVNTALMPDVGAPAIGDGGELSKGTKVGNKLFGTGGEERFQTWPERMIRSGSSLAGDVLSGEQPMLPPGVRREDYTDIPAPQEPTEDSTWLGKKLSVAPVAAQPNDPAYERAQDMAGMAGGSGLMTGAVDGTLGSAPFLRPAVKHQGRIYKGKEGMSHLETLPDDLAADLYTKTMTGDDIKHYDLGFVNEKGHFLNREQALEHGINSGLVDPSAARQGALTTQILSDSSVPGAPLAALEHAQPFYSAVEKTVADAKQTKMHGEQWANWLKNQNGVKPDEMQYTGLDKWLREQKGPVTKQQVQDFVEQNKVQVNDVVKGGKAEISHDRMMELASDQAHDEIQSHYPSIDQQSDKYFDLVQDRMHEIYGKLEDQQEAGGTKYHDLQLPGGGNYKEHLITLPKKEIVPTQEMLDKVSQRLYGWDFKYDDIPPNQQAQVRADIKNDPRGSLGQDHPAIQQNYKSSHWDEPNILAHVRTNERDVGGVPSMHLEEIQSDWAQLGRKSGFKDQVPQGYKVVEKDGKFDLHTPDGRIKDGFRSKDAAIESINKGGNLAPDMPFKQTDQWASLALKRMIQKAAAEGKTRISWTPGEAQAARYDLSKQVEGIRAKKTGNGEYHVQYMPKGSQRKDNWTSMVGVNEAVPEAKLPELVGKELAQKIVDDNSVPSNIFTPYTGLDLKVGGEGMKGFYDQILPNIVKKIGKDYGIKVKKGNLLTNDSGKFELYDGNGDFHNIFSTRQEAEQAAKSAGFGRQAKIYELKPKDSPVKENHGEVHYFDIPEKMRDDVLSKGFPLFSDTGHNAPLSALEKAQQKWATLKSEQAVPVIEGNVHLITAKPVEGGKGWQVIAPNGKVIPRGLWKTKNDALNSYKWTSDEYLKKYGIEVPKVFERYENFRDHVAAYMSDFANRFRAGREIGPDELAAWIKQEKHMRPEDAMVFRKELVKERRSAPTDPDEGGMTKDDYNTVLNAIKQINTTKKIVPTLEDFEGPLTESFPVKQWIEAADAEKKSREKSATSRREAFKVVNEPTNNKNNTERPAKNTNTEQEINVPKNRAAGGRVLASNINHTPSEAQKASGSYAKDHVAIQGLNLTIENAKGKERSGIGKDGRRWAVKMPSHYGYIKGSVGADSDHLDVYLGPHIRSDKVFVINQIDADTKKFDETKTCIGFRDLKHAVETYASGFSDGKGLERIGSIVPCTIKQFKEWVKSDNHHKPFSLQVLNS